MNASQQNDNVYQHSPKCIPYLAKISAIPRSKGGHWHNKLKTSTMLYDT